MIKKEYKTYSRRKSRERHSCSWSFYIKPRWNGSDFRTQILFPPQIRQIEELLGGSLTSLGAGEELTAGEVARVVEALVQGTRAQLDVSLLPELLLALKAALKQVTADGILQGGCMDGKEIQSDFNFCVMLAS